MECDEYIPKAYVYLNGHKIRYIEYYNRRKNHYYGSYDRDTLIIVHGMVSSPDIIWSKVIPTLSQYFRVIILDIFGFGYSNKTVATTEFFVDYLLGILKELHIDRCTVIGHSLGGYLATEFAIRFNNRVEKLVLAAPAGIMRSSTTTLDQCIMGALYPTPENILKAFRDVVFDPKIVTEDLVNDFVNRMRLPNIKYRFMSYLLSIRDGPPLRGRISRIISPTLIVWGNNDKMIPFQYLHRQYEEIPESRLEIINDCGHISPIEKPVEFNKVILGFLKDQAELI